MAKRTVAQRLAKYLNVSAETVDKWLQHRLNDRPEVCWIWTGRSHNTPGRVYTWKKRANRTWSRSSSFWNPTLPRRCQHTTFLPEITIDGRKLNVRRLLAFAEPGSRITTTCGEPRCVNPNHLKPIERKLTHHDRLPDDIDDLASDLEEIHANGHVFETLDDLIDFAEEEYGIVDYEPEEYLEALNRNRRQFRKWRRLFPPKQT